MRGKEHFRQELARCRRKIKKFNDELANYVEVTGDNEVPEIDCTVIGTSPMEPIRIKEMSHGIAYNDDGYWVEIAVTYECGEFWLSGEDELDELLKYNRRRLRKGIRVWKSENPDAELEKDDED